MSLPALKRLQEIKLRLYQHNASLCHEIRQTPMYLFSFIDVLPFIVCDQNLNRLYFLKRNSSNDSVTDKGYKFYGIDLIFYHRHKKINRLQHNINLLMHINFSKTRLKSAYFCLQTFCVRASFHSSKRSTFFPTIESFKDVCVNVR